MDGDDPNGNSADPVSAKSAIREPAWAGSRLLRHDTKVLWFAEYTFVLGETMAQYYWRPGVKRQLYGRAYKVLVAHYWHVLSIATANMYCFPLAIVRSQSWHRYVFLHSVDLPNVALIELHTMYFSDRVHSPSLVFPEVISSHRPGRWVSNSAFWWFPRCG